MSNLESKSKYEGRYFVFSVNSPHSVMVYGEESKDDSCLLFRAVGNLVPIGEDSKNWRDLQTDRPPHWSDILGELIRKKISQVYTTSLASHPESSFLGLHNTYAPRNWDYKKDPAPPAEIYFSVGDHIKDGFGKKGISVREL